MIRAIIGAACAVVLVVLFFSFVLWSLTFAGII